MSKNLQLIHDKILTSFINEDFEKVDILLIELLKESKKQQNKYYIASSHGIRGYMNYELGDINQAIEELQKAISVTQEKDRSFIDTGHLALCYSKINDLENAKYYADQAIKASEELGHKGAMYDWYNLKANILSKFKNYDEAITWCDKSINLIHSLARKEEFEINYYQPFLTKYEIYKMQNIAEKYYEIEKRLETFFHIIDEPKLHVRRDKIKFYQLKNSGQVTGG